MLLTYTTSSSHTRCLVHTQTKNEYGIEVTKIARPLPVEYLIIELTTSSPMQPKPYLVGGLDPAFPIENRESLGDIQVP